MGGSKGDIGSQFATQELINMVNRQVVASPVLREAFLKRKHFVRCFLLWWIYPHGLVRRAA